MRKKSNQISIMKYVVRRKKVIILTLLLLLFTVLLGRTVTYLNKLLVDKAIVSQNMSLFVGVASAIFALLIIEAVCWFYQNKIFCSLGYDVASEMREELYQKIMYAPYTYFEKNAVAGILSRASTYINDIGDFVTKNLVPFMLNILKFATVFLFMFALSPLLGLMIFAVLIIILVIVYAISKLSSKRNQTFKKFEIDRESKIMDSVFGLSAIVVNNGEKQTVKEFDGVQTQAVDAWNRFSRLNELFLPLVEGLWFLGIVAVYIFSFYKMGTSGFELGAVISFISYITQTNEPIKQAALNFQYFVNIKGTINKVFDILQIDTSRIKTRTEIIDDPTPEIEMKDVEFKHEFKHAHIENFSIKIPYGEKIAFVGDSGSGKTTLALLLSRIYSPESGEILISGKNIDKVKKGGYEKVVSIISNTPYFFGQRLRDNILMGSQGVTDAEIYRVLKMVGLDEEVKELKFGLDEKLHNNGDIFSESERQMLSLARILIKNPQIIIFDGYFNSIEDKQRQKVFNIVREFAKDKTVIIMCNPEDELPFECRIIKLDM